MRYVSAINTGKGFITHADKADGLTFRGRSNNVWNVDGANNLINAWISRVSGTELTEAAADDQVFAVEKYWYTSREFLVGVLTSGETKWLIDNYSTHPSIRNLLNHILDDGGIDVSGTRFQNFLDALVAEGYMTTARADVIKAGRTAP